MRDTILKNTNYIHCVAKAEGIHFKGFPSDSMPELLAKGQEVCDALYANSKTLIPQIGNVKATVEEHWGYGIDITYEYDVLREAFMDTEYDDILYNMESDIVYAIRKAGIEDAVGFDFGDCIGEFEAHANAPLTHEYKCEFTIKLDDTLTGSNLEDRIWYCGERSYDESELSIALRFAKDLQYTLEPVKTKGDKAPDLTGHDKYKLKCTFKDCGIIANGDFDLGLALKASIERQLDVSAEVDGKVKAKIIEKAVER